MAKSKPEPVGNGQTAWLDLQAAAAKLPRYEEVRIRGVDQPFMVLRMSAAEKSEMETRYAVDHRYTPESDPGAFRCSLLRATIFRDGKPVFWGVSNSEILELPGVIITPLENAALRLNGFTREEIEGTEKK